MSNVRGRTRGAVAVAGAPSFPISLTNIGLAWNVREEAFVREVEQITYDEPFSAETFVFELPVGASARGAELQVTTIDAAAALASFPVFRLEPVPPDWWVKAVYVYVTERPTLPDSVEPLATHGERRDSSASFRRRQHDPGGLSDCPRSGRLGRLGLGALTLRHDRGWSRRQLKLCVSTPVGAPTGLWDPPGKGGHLRW
jgi:hypothetical protein